MQLISYILNASIPLLTTSEFQFSIFVLEIFLTNELVTKYFE